MHKQNKWKIFIAVLLCIGQTKCFSFQNNIFKTRQVEYLETNNKTSIEIRFRGNSIYSNAYIQWSEKMLKNPEFRKAARVVNVSYINESETTSHVVKRSTSGDCPIFDSEYLQQHSKPKDLSVSPWEFYITHDDNRTPVEIVETVCRCKGCIDMETGKEDVNLISLPMSLAIPVKLFDSNTIVNVNFGCTCAFPI